MYIARTLLRNSTPELPLSKMEQGTELPLRNSNVQILATGSTVGETKYQTVENCPSGKDNWYIITHFECIYFA